MYFAFPESICAWLRLSRMHKFKTNKLSPRMDCCLDYDTWDAQERTRPVNALTVFEHIFVGAGSGDAFQFEDFSKVAMQIWWHADDGYVYFANVWLMS